MTHNDDRRKSLWDKRNGTSTLFAALNRLDGTVISETMQCHRHNEWLKCLKRLHRETPRDLDLPILCDNYVTHEHPAVKQWQGVMRQLLSAPYDAKQ